jgi:hypothetical protein
MKNEKWQTENGNMRDRARRIVRAALPERGMAGAQKRFRKIVLTPL